MFPFRPFFLSIFLGRGAHFSIHSKEGREIPCLLTVRDTTLSVVRVYEKPVIQGREGSGKRSLLSLLIIIEP